MKKPRSWKWWKLALGLSALSLATYYLMPSSGVSGEDVPTFTVPKGTLQINVLQGGEVRALKNHEVKSEIEILTKIISIIPEGYLVSEDDIREGKVLVELDSSEIKSKIVDHDIQFQTTVASYIEADENREIVKSENQSIVRETKNLALFALMDFEKYLGKNASVALLKSKGLPDTVEAFDKHVAAIEAAAVVATERAAIEARAVAANPDTKPPTATAVAAAARAAKAPPIPQRLDFAALLDGNSGSDGEAQQNLRTLGDALLLAKSELALAKQTVEASRRLADKGFITKTQLENDQVSYDKVELAVKTAETQLDLFRKYEFQKQSETFMAAYQEALHKLQRTIRENRAKYAQAQSKFETAKRRYEMELNKKEDLERQLAACVIKATQPGLVAYGSISTSSSARYSEPIEDGATVRYRQTILTIPDMSQMGAHVAIHESQVKKVRIGQKAIIRVDAEPNRILEGQVAEVAVLPDSSSSRYTPTLKVYPSTIHIAGTQDWLKPGMNAKIEIIIDQLDDIVYVPVQSIEVENDEHFCYVSEGSELRRQQVVTGGFNDQFIEIKSGVKVGEVVALTLPKRAHQDQPSAKGEAAKKDNNKGTDKPKANIARS
jgi:multidrug resistance efflux pump